MDPPDSISQVPNEHVFSPALRWHPKLTPYHIAFLLTTGGLGVTKAILVSKGKAIGSTTVEWIAGVVFALLFQFLGAYENKRRRSRYIDWIFSYDCLIVFTLCRRGRGTSVTEVATQAYPMQSSSERKGTAGSTHVPIVTAYRLLVSSVVTCFGLAKTSCAYLGLSTQTNVLDLLIGVPLALSVYYLGIFEGQERSAPRPFFDVDYSRRVRGIGESLIGLTILATVCALDISWLIFWCWSLVHALHLPSMPTHDIEYWSTASPLLLHTFRRMLIFLSVAMVQIGALPWLYVLFDLTRSLWTRIVDPDTAFHFIILSFWILEYATMLALYPYGIKLLFGLPPVGEMPHPEYGAAGVVFIEDEMLVTYMELPLGFLYIFSAPLAFYLLVLLLVGPFAILGYHIEYQELRRVELGGRRMLSSRDTMPV